MLERLSPGRLSPRVACSSLESWCLCFGHRPVPGDTGVVRKVLSTPASGQTLPPKLHTVRARSPQRDIGTFRKGGEVTVSTKHALHQTQSYGTVFSRAKCHIMGLGLSAEPHRAPRRDAFPGAFRPGSAKTSACGAEDKPCGTGVAAAMIPRGQTEESAVFLSRKTQRM